MRAPRISRRTLLRGAGVALALPALESMWPRGVGAQQVPPRRYVSLYFPNGSADFWRPRGSSDGGQGGDWQLSPILEPLQPVKSQLHVLTNVANYSPFGGHVEPSHSNCCASTWTGVRPHGEGNAHNGISVDQVIAAKIGGDTPLDSIQLGLSTLDSYEDGLPGQHSRSISWRSASEPLYKMVNPQAVFDRLTGGAAGVPGAMVDEAAATRRRALQQSVLDFVMDDARSLQTRLGSGDRQRLEQYLDAVRSLEQRVASVPGSRGVSECRQRERPGETYGVGHVPPDYDRNAHADLMIDLVAMAFECDLTRVCSFMLDDARSDFVYDFLQERVFTDEGSSEGSGRVAGYHGLQHAGDRNNGFATIGHWNAQKAARLAAALEGIGESDGASVLDHSVVVFCSGMHGGNHDPGDLPVALLGGGGITAGGSVLARDRHTVFADEQRLTDVHLTIMREVFGCDDEGFGASSGVIAQLLRA